MVKSNYKPLLEIQNLYKNFSGIKAVNNCSFGVPKGKITALIGPNGSGKSTIFNLISGIVRPDSGKIILEDIDISQKSIEHRAKNGISRGYQHSRLFNNMSVRNNLAIALQSNDFAILSSAKLPVNQTNKIDSIAKKLGIEKLLDYTSRDLSYGQKRLVEIARTFLFPHKIMLLDEPIAGVAPHLRKEISEFLDSLRTDGETILIIEHDMIFIKNLVNHIIVLDAGKVIAEGEPLEVLELKEVQKAYLGS